MIQKWAPVVLVLGAMVVIGVLGLVRSMRCDVLIDANDHDVRLEVDGVEVGRVARNQVGRFEIPKGAHHVRALDGEKVLSEADLNLVSGACWLWRLGEPRPVAVFHRAYGVNAPPEPAPEVLDGQLVDLAARGLGCAVDGAFPHTQQVKAGEAPLVIRRVCHVNDDGSSNCTEE
ncbi:MAG: hypothetical protein QM817_41385 [Archangium sp.]